MKANELLKKLGKLLGKKPNTPGSLFNSHQMEKAPVVPLLDGLGVIQLHANWRN